jgi:hypothetical protein
MQMRAAPSRAKASESVRSEATLERLCGDRAGGAERGTRGADDEDDIGRL